jgi:uncharacterized membrane protein
MAAAVQNSNGNNNNNIMQKKRAVVSWIHVLFVAPLLVYLGLASHLERWQAFLCIVIGAVVLLWHGFNLVQHLVKMGLARPIGLLFYATHALLFAPLLLYVGLTGLRLKSQSQSQSQSQMLKTAQLTLAAVGFAAFGFHAIKLYDSIKKESRY